MAPQNELNTILLGTKKGAFVFKSTDGRRSWKMSGPFFEGCEVHHMIHDTRNALLLAAVNNSQWGPRVLWSRNLGESWKESKVHPRFRKGSGLSVDAVWHIEPSSAKEPQRLYAGVAPAALFRSDDRGDTWDLVEGLTNHPTRKKWTPGAGGLCLHSILVDPRNPRRMHVAISSVGVLHSEDGGKNWRFQNKNIRANFLPNKYPEYGNCPHKLLRNPSAPEELYQVNHCGVYSSQNDGEEWTEITENLPSTFGFSLAVDPNESSKIYTIPEQADSNRVPPNGNCAVWTKRKSGHWTRLNNGLPRRAYFGTYREGMAADAEDPSGVYFGTNTGHLYASRDAGESWTRVSDSLPPILSVSASQS